MELLSHDSHQRPRKIEGSSDRSFGLVFTALFLMLGLSPLRHHDPIRIHYLALALVIFSLALALPKTLSLPNRLWTRFSLLLQKLTTPIIMTILYAVVVTPAGLIMRILGKDPMGMSFLPGASTYWVSRTEDSGSMESMRNQF